MILDPATLANLRKTQEAHMMDVCVIYRLDYREKNTRGETVPGETILEKPFRGN